MSAFTVSPGAAGVLPADVIRLTPNEWTAPFWAAAAEHRLVVPKCTSCGAHRLPPAPFCWSCRAQDVEWDERPLVGTLYSYTVVRHAVIPDVKAALPLIAAVVELPDTGGCRLIGNVVDSSVEDVRIGLDVTIGWYDVRAGESVPVFRLPSR
jgi:uncharacterized OB-fold protein